MMPNLDRALRVGPSPSEAAVSEDVVVAGRWSRCDARRPRTAVDIASKQSMFGLAVFS